MKHKISRISYLLMFIVILTSGNFQVKAAESVENKMICLPNRNLYNISWDKNKNSMVNENVVGSLTQEIIDTGYISYPAGISDSEKEKYKITPTLLSTSCYLNNGEIGVCPSNSEKASYNVSRLIEVNNNSEYKYIDYVLNLNNGTFDIKIKDLYKGKLKVRAVRDGAPNNDYGVNSATSYNDFISKQGDYFVVKNARPSTFDGTKINQSKIKLEFYVNDSSSKCNNSYVASLDLIVSTLDDSIKVDNPAKNDASYGCSNIYSYINALINMGIVQDKSEELNVLKYNYASMCYNDKISYGDYKNLRSKIEQQLNDLKTLISVGTDSGTSSITGSGNVVCNNKEENGERVVVAMGGSYWNLVCKEKYSTQGDTAKLVYAGAGFSYYGIFKATKTCTLTQTAQVVLRPQCVYSCETMCSYDEKAGRVTGKDSAGPNEDFDSCINTCDNGKYTQECINTCYSKVYGNNRELPKLDSKSKTLSFLDDNYEIQKIDNTYTVPSSAGGTFIGWSTDGAGNPKAMYRVDVPTKHCGTVGVTFSSYCDNHNGECTIYESVGPSGCVDNPQALYASELNASLSEFSSMLEKMNAEIPGGDYKIQIADSYLNNKGNAYVYELSTANQENVIVSNSGDWSCPGGNRSWTFGSQGESASACQQSKVTKTVQVSLPTAYLSKKTGLAMYEVKNGRYAQFYAKTPSTRLEAVKNFNIKDVYSAGNKYYTNILSDNVNVNVPSDKTSPVTLVGASTAFAGKKAGINVYVSNFGTGSKYNNSIKCYYGVYNSTVDKDDDDSNGGGGNKPSNGGGGITIIYRPIDLNDNFPNNRNPRWNWTSGATSMNDKFLNYNVNPVKTNQDIENKGYTIYNDSNEIDYDITLTPENIMAIRSYNKNVDDYNQDGYTNYLDYDLSCYSRKNRDICTSKFLDNEKYVKFNNVSNTERQDMAKCNNTYNKACVD